MLMSNTLNLDWFNLDNSKKRTNSTQTKNLKEQLIISLTKFLEIHDTYTNGHSQNVANLSVMIGRAMQLSKQQLEDIYWAGLVHDIGKILVPLSILNKEGPLTDEEYDEVKIHPLWGYIALQAADDLKNIAIYIKHHHERWDGTGYPDRISGDEIPLISQILAISDAWDAMTSKRSYRNAMSISIAIEEIKKNRGTQFSPEITDVFIGMLQKYFNN